MFGSPFSERPVRLSVISVILASGAIVLSAACASNAGGASAPMNTLTAAEQRDGWKLVFDGKTTAGWRNYRKQTVGPGWTVVDGVLTRSGENAGDIITDGQYRNFDLMLDWRISEGGNSGVMYRASEEGNYVWQSGPEMQILDDARHADGKSQLTSAGSVFAVYPAPRGIVRPAGEWNSARVLVDGNHVEHWLNGTKVVEYELGSAGWVERVAASKWAREPLYGRAPSGHIGLQDHGDRVEFRNIRVKVLP